MSQTIDVNVTRAEFKANPYPFYARLRAEAPVYRTVLPDKRAAWLVTRYDDVVAVIKDERFVKDRRNAMTPEQLKKVSWIPGFLKALDHNMLDLDAPDHTRLRALVHKAFTPHLIEQMRERIQSLTEELLDAAERRESMELIHDYALPVPVTIIAQMLGVRPEHYDMFHKGTSAMVSMTNNSDLLRNLPRLALFMRFLRKMTNERRIHPQDDLTTALVQAEEAGDTLSEDELLAMVFLLLAAGHETTVNLIGNGTLALLQHPDQMEKLTNDPSLIKSAVEELARYSPPVEKATERYAREDVTIAGVTIPQGEAVFAIIASANRDEQYFANPDALDITRENNKHLSFGQGIHYCLGAPLARMEGQVAINTLLRRMPNLRLKDAPETLRWRGGLVLRGLEALPVTF